MDIVDILFRSKIRRKILMRFFADESRNFYINEMARLIDTSQGTCRRELNRLADVGILLSLREGNLQYYSLNKHYPFYKEFKSIVQKTIGIEASIRSALQGIEGITFAFIFGSYAKKHFGPESDVDIVIIGDVSEQRLVQVFKGITKITGREINYHVYMEKEFKAKLRSNSFMQNIISAFIMVAGDERGFRELLKKA